MINNKTDSRRTTNIWLNSALFCLVVCLVHSIKANQNEPNPNSGEINTYSDVLLPDAFNSDVPQNVTLEASSSTSVIVRWEPPPKDSQNSIITGYKIKYKIKGNKNKQETVTTDGNRRLYELTNLEKGATYMVKVASVFVNGSGSYTDWFTIETYSNDLDESQVPDKPSSLSAKPYSNTITIHWKPPKNQNIMIRGYTIGWGIGIPDVYTKVLDGKHLLQGRSFTIDNLQPSSEYVISLRAYNNVGDGQPIYETVKTLIESTPEPQTPIIPPVGLKAQVLSSSSVVLYWTDTTLSKNQQVNDRRYVVRYTSSLHSNNPKFRYYNTTDLNCMIDDLKPNTQYEFAVKVVRGKRESTWSMSVLNTTQEAAPSSPPRDLTVVPSANDDPTVINLHWQPPKQPNGQITGYVIFYTTDNTQRDRDWVVEGVIGDKMTTLLKGLLPSSTYYFKIQARNNKGYGPISSEVSFKTLPAMLRSTGHESKYPPASTLYIIIAVISGITVLLLIVVGTLLCRSRNNAGGSYMRKQKGYIAAATSPGKTISGGKGKGGRELKPPDLWIHHDQMELKSMEKGLNGDAMTITPIHRNSQDISDEPYEKSKKTNSTYGDSLYDDINKDIHKRASSPADNGITVMGGNSTLRKSAKTKPILIPADQSTPVNGTISLEPSTALSRPLYPRTQFNIARAHVTLDANDSTQNISNSHHIHHFYDPVATPHLQMGINSTSGTSQMASNSAYSSGISSQVIPSNGPSLITSNMTGKRQLGHSLKSFSVPSPPVQTTCNIPTSTHHISVRPQIISSPHKKAMQGNSFNLNSSASHKSNHIISPSNRGTDSIKREELASSYSTEELNQEMANLEGLMKDLSAITAKEFNC